MPPVRDDNRLKVIVYPAEGEVWPNETLINNALFDENALHNSFGLALTFGVCLMFTIEFATHLFGKWKRDSRREPSEDAVALREIQKERLDGLESKDSKAEQTEESKDMKAQMTTMGLVVHSASDGVALGASLFCKFQNTTYYSFQL